MEKQERFNVTEACEAQAKLIKEKGHPDFPPESGVCWACKRNIYQKLGNTGISVEKAGKSLITGCPHCNRSYCS